MRSLRFCLTAIAAVAVSAPVAADFSLDGPHLYKSHRRASNLVTGDFNASGTTGFAVVSNDEGVIHLFVADDDPEAERPFRREEVALDRIVRGMVSLDVNGNGRDDLVVAAQSARMAIFYQREDGRFGAPVSLGEEAAHLSVGDITGNGRDDLLVTSGREFRIHAAGTRGLDLENPTRFHTTREPAGAPMLVDLDGDGKIDIAWRSADSRESIIVRFQSPTGEFPDEVVFSTPTLRTLSPVLSRDAAGRIVGINARNRQLHVMEYRAPDSEDAGREPFGEPRFVSFDPSMTDASAFPLAVDVDGDGRLDLVMATPNAPMVRVLRQGGDGSLRPLEVPSLEDIRTLLPWPGEDGETTALIAHSRKENTVAMVPTRSESPFLRFPVPMNISGQVHAVSVASLDEASGPVLLLALGTAREHAIHAAPVDIDAANAGEKLELFAMEDTREAPTAIVPLDLNRNGRTDLLVYYNYQSPRVLLQDEEGGFELLEAEGLLAGLLDGADTRTFREVAIGDDGAIAALKRQFVRVFHLDEDNRVVVHSQLNAPGTSSRFESMAVGDFTGSGKMEFAVLDAGTRQILVYIPGSDGEYEIAERIGTDSVGGNLRFLEAASIVSTDRDDLVAVAADRIAIHSSSLGPGAMETIVSRETKVEDGGYGGTIGVWLADEASQSVLAFEMKDSILEFLSLDETGALDEFYRFKMYDSEASIARRVNLDAPPEPREIATADLNGDGHLDLIALTHDYLIVYYQRDAEESEGDDATEVAAED